MGGVLVVVAVGLVNSKKRRNLGCKSVQYPEKCITRGFDRS